MTACPSRDLIVELLDERLQGPELAEIVAHIEDCLRCQTHLEDLTRAAGRITTLKEVAAKTESESEAAADPTVRDESGPAADVGGTPRIEGAGADPEPTIRSPSPFTDQGQPADPHRTHPEIGLGNGSVSADRGGPRTDFPEVPGYEIIERLGEGGMGIVYKARQLGLNRPVALKMIRGGSQARPGHFRRFATEAEAVARLRHANILQIYDIGQANGLPYVALELLEGGRLHDRLAGTPQPAGFAAELLATLARAVQKAHEAGIIHRDLKPANVLYTSDGVPKITDFGLAKRIDSNDHHTESGQIMGSPSYMAPEQARGHSRGVGAAADVYALGAILYEMLTGRPPFKGETPMETVRQVLDDEPVPPSRLVPRLPRDLETICLKCLHKDPARRYASAQALADDLVHYLHGEPILARPTPAWERAAKWARRRPLAAAAWILGGSLFLGLTAGGFAYEHNLRIDQQKLTETILARQTAGLSLLEKADAARSQGELEQAQLELSEFFPGIANERRLKSLAVRIADKRKWVRDQLAALQSQQADRDRLRADRDLFQKFRALRRQAQLYAVRLGVIEPADYQKSLRDTALAALAVFAQDPGAPAGDWSLVRPLPEALDQAEQDEVKGGCFDLLLILSEALGPAEGLKVLDRAAALRPEPTPAHHLRRAAILFQTGDKAGRAREEQLANNLPPTTALDHLALGREQLARGQFRDAIHSSQSAIRLDPDQLGAHLILAVAYFNTQRYSEAKASLNTCIQTAPELLGLYLFRALVSGEEGNRALVRIRETPARAAEWQLEAAESFAAAEADYHHALELRPSPDLRYVLLVNRGGMSLQAGRLDQALADGEAAVELNARHYHAHALLFQICQRQGRLEEAARALDRAIERQPDRPELFRARALLVARPHEKEERKSRDLTPAQRARAIGDLEQAIRLEPANSPQTAEDHAERGRLLVASGQTTEALAAYDAALRIAPEDLKALRLRTLALLELERYDDVLAACDAFLARGKPSADLLEVRGQARLARKDFGGAISDYTVALSLTPGSAALLNRRGWAYLFSDAFKLALADFDAAVRQDSDLGHAYSGRGLALVSLGRWRDAVADVETAVRLATAGLKQQALYNAARVHALSLKYAAEEVSRRGEAGLALHRRLRDRAAALLLESVRQLPADRQALFWREVVASDPVLRQFIP